VIKRRKFSLTPLLKELEVVAGTEHMLTAEKFPLEKQRRLLPIQVLHSEEKVMRVTGPLPTFTTC